MICGLGAKNTNQKQKMSAPARNLFLCFDLVYFPFGFSTVNRKNNGDDTGK